MSKTAAWISSLRLRTLPLALASVLMGSILALEYRLFDWETFVLIAITAIFLQILSNLANDYGDTLHGADNAERIGPKRGLQSGDISLPQLKYAIIICTVLALVSGLWLLSYAAKGTAYAMFLLIGLLCIAAAVTYTLGKKPYGYIGLGDVAVFCFFGIVGVACTFYLFTQGFRFDILLPACTMGFLSAGVLNINNMRDYKNDFQSGKKTLVVRIGLESAKRYHYILVILAFAAITLYTLLQYHSPYQWLYLITIPLFIIHLWSIKKATPENMDKYLKQLSLTTLFLVISFGAGIMLQYHV